MTTSEEVDGSARGKATVSDVARVAGISVATVSRVFGGGAKVSENSRQRVLAAAAELDYTPNTTARSLRTGVSRTVGLVLPTLKGPFFPMLANVIEEACRLRGLATLVTTSGSTVAGEAEALRVLLGRAVDGIIISPVHRHDSARMVEDLSVQRPIVQVDRFASEGVDAVVTDADATVRIALAHMRSLQRENLVFVGEDNDASSYALRAEAFRRHAGATSAEQTLTGPGGFEWGWAASEEISQKYPDVQGVVCADDLIALGVMQSLLARGTNVPQQVAITGCDNTLFSLVSKPRITTIAQPLEQMAEIAVEMLTDRKLPGKHVELEPTLISRESTQQ